MATTTGTTFPFVRHLSGTPQPLEKGWLSGMEAPAHGGLEPVFIQMTEPLWKKSAATLHRFGISTKPLFTCARAIRPFVGVRIVPYTMITIALFRSYVR